MVDASSLEGAGSVRLANLHPGQGPQRTEIDKIGAKRARGAGS
jgi:hypothetical protein